ncbi:hypothetical protein V1511DRAFT_494931 [Dipodascopsis uninucleata]
MPLPIGAVIGIGLGISAGVTLGMVIYNEREQIIHNMENMIMNIKIKIQEVRENERRRRTLARVLAHSSDDQELMYMYDFYDKSDSEDERNIRASEDFEGIEHPIGKSSDAKVGETATGLRHRRATSVSDAVKRYPTPSVEDFPEGSAVVSKSSTVRRPSSNERFDTYESSLSGIETPSSFSDFEVPSDFESVNGEASETQSEAATTESFDFLVDSGMESAATSGGYTTEDDSDAEIIRPRSATRSRIRSSA